MVYNDRNVTSVTQFTAFGVMLTLAIGTVQFALLNGWISLQQAQLLQMELTLGLGVALGLGLIESARSVDPER